MSEPQPQPKPEELLVTIDDARGGTRLDKLLRDLAPAFSRTYLKELIEKGFVQVGKRVITKPGFPVHAGQELRVTLVPKRVVAAQPKKEPLRIVYQDEFLAVIDKPPGMASHPSPQTDRTTVADAALAMFGQDLPRGQGLDRPGIVHRLDRDTTGVMVLAKTESAFHSLRAQFKERTTEKEYRAIVRGQMRFDSDYIEGLIGRDPGNPEKMALHREGGKDSLTYYEVLERFEDFSFVRLMPKTGRTHQLRVHLTSLGHPIVGDKVYKIRGAQWNAPTDAPSAPRQFLHAFSLSFLHPNKGERVYFEAPLHRDMAQFLAFLRRSSKKSQSSD